MATDQNLTIAIESAIHDALAEFAIRIEREHGIAVTCARFEWFDITMIGEADTHKLRSVKIEAYSGVPRHKNGN